jgi:hypothetical protein
VGVVTAALVAVAVGVGVTGRGVQVTVGVKVGGRKVEVASNVGVTSILGAAEGARMEPAVAIGVGVDVTVDGAARPIRATIRSAAAITPPAIII